MGITSLCARYDSSNPIENAQLAVQDIKRQLAGKKPEQILFFAAGNYDAKTIASAMREAFPEAITLGCSTSGELADTAMMTGSVSAMAFDGGAFEFFDAAVLKRLDADGNPTNPSKEVRDAFARFEEKLGRSMDSLEYDKYVGFVFADGLQYFIEPVLDRVGDLTSVPFMGGVAGDDGAFVRTPVFCNGESYSDAVVLAIAKPAGKFAILKTEGLDILDRTFIVTGADEERRLVTHLDGRPAATAYSEAIGVPEEQMDFRSTFALWPFGLMVGDEPFLRVAVERMPDSSLRFLSAVKEGMRLKLARTTGIVNTTKAALAKMREQIGSISAIFHVNCMSRHHELTKDGECEAFGALFAGYPHAGFSSHGEFYIAIANDTSTMLVFA